MAIENIMVGTMAIARVGRNAIEVEVIALEDGGAYRVRNQAGREFSTARLEPLTANSPKTRISLFDAALQALRALPAGASLNTRELVALTIERGLWAHNGAKTPEQTLYSAIFREIATKEHPRIVKAEHKGKFRLA